MSRGLIFSPSYNLITTCWLKEVGLLGRDCDILLISDDAELALRLADSGYFSHVLQPDDQGVAGMTLWRRQQALDSALLGSGRPFRQKSRYMELLSPERFFDSAIKGWDKFYTHTTDFEARSPYVERILWQGGAFSCWEHGILYSTKGAGLRGFISPHFSDSHSLWLGLHGIGHPRDRLSELLTGCPGLVPPAFRERVVVKEMPKIRRDNMPFKKAINHIFGFTEVMADFPPVVFFPRGFGSFLGGQPLEQRFLEQAIAILGEGAIAVKEHPASIWEKRRSRLKVRFFPDAALPWELNLLNYGGWSDRLFISMYCTTALLTAKAHYGDEPYVLNLARLFPEFKAKPHHEELHLELAHEMRELYRNPEKFCIPESWEEVWEFLRMYRKNCL